VESRDVVTYLCWRTWSCGVIVLVYKTVTVEDIRYESYIILTFDIIKMSLSKLSDSDVQLLIELWRNERSLGDVTIFPNQAYSNAVERKAAVKL